MTSITQKTMSRFEELAYGERLLGGRLLGHPKHLVPIAFCLAVACCSNAMGVMTIGFEFEDDGVTPLVAGQKIDTEFSSLFSISSNNSRPNGSTNNGGHKGPAIFDSDTTGSTADPDLLVGLGNILILQSTDSPNDGGGSDIFVTPNDEAGGGTIIFDFVHPAYAVSIDLVDINGNGSTKVTLVDGNGRNRVYDVPREWTGDVANPSHNGTPGYLTLDLTTLASQTGIDIDGAGVTYPVDATASEQVGFNAWDVTKMEVSFEGSAGLDNLVFSSAPEASSCAWWGLTLCWLYGRARRKRPLNRKKQG